MPSVRDKNLGDADGVSHEFKIKPVLSIWCVLHTQASECHCSSLYLPHSKLFVRNTCTGTYVLVKCISYQLRGTREHPALRLQVFNLSTRCCTSLFLALFAFYSQTLSDYFSDREGDGSSLYSTHTFLMSNRTHSLCHPNPPLPWHIKGRWSNHMATKSPADSHSHRHILCTVYILQLMFSSQGTKTLHLILTNH